MYQNFHVKSIHQIAQMQFQNFKIFQLRYWTFDMLKNWPDFVPKFHLKVSIKSHNPVSKSFSFWGGGANPPSDTLSMFLFVSRNIKLAVYQWLRPICGGLLSENITCQTQNILLSIDFLTNFRVRKPWSFRGLCPLTPARGAAPWNPAGDLPGPQTQLHFPHPGKNLSGSAPAHSHPFWLLVIEVGWISMM